MFNEEVREQLLPSWFCFVTYILRSSMMVISYYCLEGAGCGGRADPWRLNGMIAAAIYNTLYGVHSIIHIHSTLEKNIPLLLGRALLSFTT